MSAVELLRDLFFIERGYLNGNHFVYRSEEPILIDTGYISGFDATSELITKLGVDLANVRLIINTHTHCDHIGGNKWVQEKSACDIALHRIGKHFIDTRDDWSTWWKYYSQQALFFDCTKALGDGDLVTIGPHEFQVIHTPGHAADGIVLYHRKAKILISSDTLWENDMAVMTLRVEGSQSLFLHLDSLKKLSALDIEAAYPGHGQPFFDVAKAIARARKRTQDLLKDRKKLGNDLLKKITIYTLLMHGTVKEATFFEHLMQTSWFKETVALYFDGAYKKTYERILHGLLRKGLVKRKAEKIYTTVKP